MGRSHECDFPPAVRRLPVCTAPKLDVAGSSREIDRQVKDLLRQAVSVFRVDAEKLKELRPDVILTQSQCDVCAVSLAEVEEVVGQWLGSRPRLISLSPQTLAGVWDDIGHVAEVLGVAERGKDLLRRLKNRCVDVIEKVCAVERRPSVACIEWIEPLMAAGNWVPDLVDLAGGLDLFGEAGKHSPWLNWEAVRAHDPEIIVVMPCGFDLARTRQEMPALMRKADWSKLRAVTSGRVRLADGSQYFNRPGPRLVESLEILAEIFHPDIFNFRHEGRGWQREITEAGA